MQEPLFDETDKAKIKRYVLIAAFVAIFVVVGLTIIINAFATDDETQQQNTQEIIDLLEN